MKQNFNYYFSILNEIFVRPIIYRRILFTEEVSLTISLNLLNERVYYDANPHQQKGTRYQHEFKVNISVEIIDNSLIEPVLISNTLIGNNY